MDTNLTSVRIPKRLNEELKGLSKLVNRSAANLAQTILEQAIAQMTSDTHPDPELLPIVLEVIMSKSGNRPGMTDKVCIESILKRLEALEESRKNLGKNP